MKQAKAKKSPKSSGSRSSKKSVIELLGRKRIIIALFVSVMGILLIVSTLFFSDDNNASYIKTNSAGGLVDVCQTDNDTSFACYKAQLEQITLERSPKEAFALIKQQYSTVDYVKSQCHQLAHVVGRAAYARYGTIADTFAQGDKYCWSGYYHGATEQLIDEKGFDYAIENANSLCDPIAKQGDQSFYHYNCVHGLGHGFMFALDGDLFKSLTACDSISDDWERTSCYGGVFMQNIMNVQGPDADPSKQNPYLREDEPMYPCTEINEKYKGQCYLMQTSYALQTVSYSFKKGFEMCDKVDKNYRSTCYTSLGRDASGTSISNVQSTKSNCLLGSTYEAQRDCINGAASDFVSYHHNDQQAYELCDSLPNPLQSECKTTVKNYYSTF